MIRMQRNIQTDVLRGIGILLVVLGHNWLVLQNKEFMFRAIYAFHMPLFFFISGLFIKSNEGIISASKKKIASIVKPYISVCIFVSLTYWLAKGKLEQDVLWGILYGNGNTLIWPWLWFLPCLFVSSFAATCFVKISKNRNSIVLALVFCLLLFGYFVHIHIAKWQPPIFQIFTGKSVMAAGLPLNLDLAPIATACILLGYATPKVFFTQKPSFTKVFAALIVLLGVHIAFNPVLDMNERILQNPVAACITAVLSIYLAIELSKYVASNEKASNALSEVGKASLFIYLFHFPLQALFTFKLLNLAPSVPALGYVAGLAVGVLVPYLLYIARYKIGLVALLLVPKRAHGS